MQQITNYTTQYLPWITRGNTIRIYKYFICCFRYNAHHDSEVKIVERYSELIDEESDILVQELNEFLNDFPKEIDISPTQMKRRASQVSEGIQEDEIPEQLKRCGYQVDAVHNWMFG